MAPLNPTLVDLLVDKDVLHMNYVRELNAFHDWLETNPLDAITQTLWYHLMAIANKCNWPEWFTVANLTLQAKLGVDKKTIIKHRNILVQKGRLDYQTQGKQQAGRYKIITIEVGSGNIPLERTPDRTLSRGLNRPLNRTPLYKLNETKLDNKDDDTHALTLAQIFSEEYGRLLSPLEIEQISKWQEKQPDEIILEALKRAVSQGVLKAKYIDSILLDWEKQNCRTVAEILEHEKQFCCKGKKTVKNPAHSPPPDDEKFNLIQWTSKGG